jgi:probable rRNA maturation factor
MMIRITLSDRRFRIDRRRLKSLAQSLLQNESAGAKEIDIIYCSHRLMRDLNRSFMGEDRTSDVLAFNLDGGDKNGFLGEIYVNLQQARIQAEDYAIKYSEEVERLTVHGILHLLGYDDRGKKNREKMWARQEGFLRKWKR